MSCTNSTIADPLEDAGRNATDDTASRPHLQTPTKIMAATTVLRTLQLQNQQAPREHGCAQSRVGHGSHRPTSGTIQHDATLPAYTARAVLGLCWLMLVLRCVGLASNDLCCSTLSPVPALPELQ